MMTMVSALIRSPEGVAAAELALIAPLLILLAFGSVELGNYFMVEHAVIKQVRDGARYGSRLTIAPAYACTAGSDLSGIFEDSNASTNIVNVTKTGSVDGTATGRFASGFWTACAGSANPVTVSVRCVDKSNYSGVYSTLAGNIPVLKVQANVAYPSIFNAVGLDAGDYCLRAESESAVYGL